MSTFDSTKTRLEELLREIVAGEIQLPDFQRGWVWNDEHIRSLLTSIARAFPVGAVTELTSQCIAWIGQIRRVLAETCLYWLQPDLIILDEFQRFKHLMAENSDEKDDAAALVEHLFS